MSEHSWIGVLLATNLVTLIAFFIQRLTYLWMRDERDHYRQNSNLYYEKFADLKRKERCER